jgi:hypothetical protein
MKEGPKNGMTLQISLLTQSPSDGLSPLVMPY